MESRNAAGAVGSHIVRRTREAHRAKAPRSRPRALRVEWLEPRQLLSGAAAAATAKAAPLDSGLLQAGYAYNLWAKATPDQWFDAPPGQWQEGVGKPYVPYSAPAPSADAIPRVNQQYVWGMTQTSSSIWFATAANVSTGFSLAAQNNGPYANNYQVVEGAASTYPLVPPLLKDYIGDWRPPKVYKYNLTSRTTTEVTPADPIILRTLGFRSAGANSQVVLFAGPTITMTGMNLLAYDATSGKYLGSTTMREYTDIRQWVTVNDQLYAGVLRTVPSPGAEGAVIRWTGTKANPFQFSEVGRLDLEGAFICAYQGRLCVSTWPSWGGTAAYIAGYRSTDVAGIWMSPPVGYSGLTAKDAGNWKKVWSITEYEPDPVLAGTYGGGALYSFDGYLYWGTLNTPLTPTMFLEKYPDSGVSPTDLLSPVRREATLFRAKNLGGIDSYGRRATEKIDLLYGDPKLPVYVANPADGTTHWVSTYNNMGPVNGMPLWGYAGYRSELDANSPKTRTYTYTMAVYNSHLFVGTEDFITDLAGGALVDANGYVDAAQSLMQSQMGFTDVSLGADLWMLSPDLASRDRTGKTVYKPVKPVLIDEHGIDNAWNMGVRTMISNSSGLFLGTSSSSNLVTQTYNPPSSVLKPGGWEFIQVVLSKGMVKAQTASALAAVSSVHAVDSALALWTTSPLTASEIAAIVQTFTAARKHSDGTATGLTGTLLWALP
jgi:hypothetical protein